MRIRNSRQMETEFILDLGVACDLWRRPDLGDTPKSMKHVAQILLDAGIEVYEVTGGWLECESRPAGIWEALSGELAPVDWVEKFNYPQEKPGSVLQILAEKGRPVSNFK